MILFDSLYINNGGGKVLLDFLIHNLEKTELNVYYLVDARVKNNIPRIKNSNKVKFLEATVLNRTTFYLTHRNEFNLVFCFGNIPPFFHCNAEVLTYFHNLLYINNPVSLKLSDKFKLELKKIVLIFTKNNTSFWIVQSKLIGDKLKSKFNIPSNQIKILPFYDNIQYTNIRINREKGTYIYISNGNPHKNHEKLIEAFSSFYDKYRKGVLLLTVSDEHSEVCGLVSNKIRSGYPIINLGVIDRKTIQQYCLKSEFLIYPSLTESFGLGIIEAIECGCNVLGADLPYMYEVCEPSLVFDPTKTISIFRAIEKSYLEEVNHTIPKIQNNINELLNLLNKTTCD